MKTIKSLSLFFLGFNYYIVFYNYKCRVSHNRHVRHKLKECWLYMYGAVLLINDLFVLSE